MPVHVVPHLGHDEQIFPFYNALFHGCAECLPDAGLIAVAGGAVKQPWGRCTPFTAGAWWG